MHLRYWHGDTLYAIAQRNAVMTVCAGVKYHSVGVGILQLLHQRAFAVMLTALHLYSQRSGVTPYLVFQLLKGVAAVKGDVAPAQHVHVDTVKQK